MRINKPLNVCPGSVHGGHHYLNATRGLHLSEREEHRKAARIALDTSAHAGSLYNDNMLSNYDQVRTLMQPCFLLQWHLVNCLCIVHCPGHLSMCWDPL